MKKKLFLITFTITQLFFVFFYIHKQSTLIQLSYSIQKNEQCKKQLEQEKQLLQQKLYVCQTKTAIKEYAEKSLGLRSVNLGQVHPYVI